MEMDFSHAHWKSGFRAKVKAADAVQVLTEINERDGCITPSAVVEEASSEDSPLHPQFEWDNSTAANLYREDQARSMIRELVVPVTIEKPDREPEEVIVRVFQAEPSANEDGEFTGSRVYVRTVDILEDEERSDLLLNAFRREMKSTADRYRVYSQLAELPKVQAVLDAVEELVG